jgi:hypothetical protein
MANDIDKLAGLFDLEQMAAIGDRHKAAPRIERP